MSLTENKVLTYYLQKLKQDPSPGQQLFNITKLKTSQLINLFLEGSGMETLSSCHGYGKMAKSQWKHLLTLSAEKEQSE